MVAPSGLRQVDGVRHRAALPRTAFQKPAWVSAEACLAEIECCGPCGWSLRLSASKAPGWCVDAFSGAGGFRFGW